ncbi:hypothetical protein AM500_13570 [Bacillus sp. FJAT-18017]|uniref:nucleotidyltransferase family protein n=1 Tax=Bacillus sp. FJAT-18017 TaxID=1705566 RepID=UPI0006AE6778|nr:nucleotidyltransferase family protein [Bacillus sp. FJAT-18017]ALC90699.1 hypothetical protein AM500_13570 [Bacillus sp. FJAT-18017]
MLKNEEDIIRIIREDEWMMEILKAAQSLDLSDWWVCAGFVRSKIWDTLHGFTKRTATADVDVIYFDPKNTDEQTEKKLEQKLLEISPEIPWSVKNQARMHVVNNISPYISSVDAISKFPETATAIGVKLDRNDKIMLTAPHGIEDVIKLIVKPTPYFAESSERIAIFEQRIKKKDWKSRWGQVIVNHVNLY